MRAEQSRNSAPAECLKEVDSWSAGAGSTWQSAADERVSAKERFSRLATTLEADVIPRLVRAHQAASTPVAAVAAALPSARQVAAFTELILHAGDAELSSAVDGWRRSGLSVVSLCLHLLAPTAR